MSLEVILTTIAKLHKYLEKSTSLCPSFSDDLENILSSIHKYINDEKPHHIFIRADKADSWLVAIIATYTINKAEISIDLVAYLDNGYVKFLRSSSSPNPYSLVEEKISSYISFGHQDLQSQDENFLCLYSQIKRIAYLAPRGCLETLLCLEEILETLRIKYLRGQEIDLLIKSLIEKLGKTNKIHDLKWNIDLLNQVNRFATLVDYEIDMMRVVKIHLLFLLPHVETFSNHLYKAFTNLHQDITLLSSLTLDFLSSLLREISEKIIKTENYEFRQWESALLKFFNKHKEECFNKILVPNYSPIPVPGITTLTSPDHNITSNS